MFSEAQQRYSKLAGFDTGKVKHISTVLAELTGLIDRNLTGKFELTGIPTGFDQFDKFSNGLQNGDLIIIAGETSNGKTSLALNIGQYASKTTNIGVFSYEMVDRQLAARMLSAESFVSSKEILYSRLSSEQLDKVNVGIGKLAESQIYIYDAESSNYDYLERSIRSLVINQNIGLVIIDYLQLIKIGGNRYMSKTEQMAEIANSLKNLAKTLNIPILLLSQLTRDKNNPMPTLVRLKGSGDIENAADIVWFVWRPELYNRDDFTCINDTYTARKNSHHIIAKGRNIGITEFVLGFEKEITMFTNNIFVEDNPY